MPQFTFTNRLMEKALRRAFLDGVMEIYESSNQPRVYSITLEGTLSLLINKTEKYYIKLQETAERAKEPDHKLLPKSRLLKLAEVGGIKDAKENVDVANDRLVNQNCIVTVNTVKSESGATPGVNPTTISTTKTPIMTFQSKSQQRIAPKPYTTTTVTVVSPRTSTDNNNSSLSYTVINSEDAFSLDKVKKEPSNTSSQVSSTKSADIKKEPIDDDQAVSSTNDKVPGSEVMVVQPEWIAEEADQGAKRSRDDDDDDEEPSTSAEEARKKIKVALRNPIMAINLGSSQRDMLYYHKNIVECPLCKEPINNQTFLLLHLEKHRKELADECEDCQQEGRPIDALLYHLTNFHTPDGHHETDFQRIKAPNLNTVHHFSTEPRVDATKMVKCLIEKEKEEQAMFMASSANIVVKHEVVQDSSGPEFPIEYVCDLCGSSHASNKELALHYQAEHGNSSGTYTCPSCPACFDDVFKFQNHLLEHHKVEEKCKCTSCDMTFDKWKDLKSHLLTAHRKFFTCPQCKVSFNDEESLKDHVAMHEANKPDFYECDMCDKSFASAKTYNAHRRSHIDVKPYVCPICQSAFFKRGDMAKHMRTIHEPTKLYMCKICGRTGTRADNMRVHVRTHKKEISREQVDQLLQKVDQ